MLVGVNNIVVNNLDYSADANEIVISARPYKRDRCRCGICGRKVPGYNCGNGLRRWRAMDIGNSVKVYVESKAVRVNCPEMRNRTLGPPLENNPEIPPSSRDEGLRLLHGLATNLATSLQTPQEA